MLLHDFKQFMKTSYYAYQLYSIKRCFSRQSSVGFVSEPGVVKEYSTLSEMADDKLVPNYMRHFDKLILNVPNVQEVSNDDLSFYDLLKPPAQIDCPNYQAKLRQARAKARAMAERELAKHVR